MAAMQRKVDAKEDQYRQLMSYQAILQHEFRTPVAATIMILNQVSTFQLAAEALRCVKIVLGTQQLLLHIVNGLLDFRSIEQGSFERKMAVFRPRKVITLV